MGSMLSEPNKEFIGGHVGEFNNLSFGVSSIQGWRTEMEDQHLVVPQIPGLEDHSLFAVFDGHGGKNAAIFAARELLERLQQTKAYTANYLADHDPQSLSTALRQAFLDVDELMRKSFNPRLNPNERSGCTAIAVVVTPTHIVTANAGDSRGLICRGGTSLALSFDHKPWLAAEKERIEQAGGCVSMKRVDGELAVSRALGDFQFKNESLPPEQCKVTANPDMLVLERSRDEDQFLVLACDGIWDVMSNNDVVETLTGYATLLGEGNPQLLSEELIEDCLARGSRDNMSALTVLFEPGRKLVSQGKSGVIGLRAKRSKEAAKKDADFSLNRSKVSRRT